MYYEQFNIHLLHIGYNKCHENPNVYIRITMDGKFILFELYVDDFIFIST